VLAEKEPLKQVEKEESEEELDPWTLYLYSIKCGGISFMP
jgi:hypothetical protein